MHLRSSPFVVAFGLIAGLLLVVGVWTARTSANDALILNLAGRQRMLSQRITSGYLSAVLRGADPTSIADLESLAREFEQGLGALTDGGSVAYGDSVVSLPAQTDSVFRAALNEVQASWEEMRGASTDFVARQVGGPGLDRALANLEETSLTTLNRMDLAVRMFQAAADTRTRRSFRVQVGLALLASLALAMGFLGAKHTKLLKVQLARERAEAELGESESRLAKRLAELEQVYGTAPVGLCFLDTNLRYVRVNDRLAEINGLPASEHIGRTLQQILPDVASDVEPVYRQVIASGEPVVDSEVHCTTPADPNVERDWLTSYFPVKDEGVVVGVTTVVQEITEIKLSRNRLRESEQRFRDLFQNAPFSIWEEDFSQVKTYLDDLGFFQIEDVESYLDEHPEVVRQCAQKVKVLAVNRRAAELHEAEDEAELLKELPRTFTEASYTAFKQELVAIGRGETACDGEGEVATLKGTTRDVVVRWSVVPGHEKDLGRVLVSLLDVTDRKLAERELRRNEIIVASSSDMLALLDKKYTYLAANPAYLKAFGMTHDQLVGHTVPEVFGEEFFNGVIRRNADQCLDGATVRYQEWFDFPASEKRYMDINYRPYLGLGKDVRGIVVNARDITDQKRAQDSALENQKLMEETQEVARLGSYALDIPSGTWGCSTALFDIFGIDDSFDRTVKGWLTLVHPDDRQVMHDYLNTEVLENRGRFDKEYRIVRYNDGHECWVHGLGELEYDERGEPARMIGTIQDVTARVRVDRKLKESEQRFRTLAASSPVGIFLDDAQGKAIFVNDECARLVGLSPEECLGSDWVASIHPDDRERVVKRWQKSIEEGSVFEQEHRWLHKDGQVNWTLAMAAPVKDEAGHLSHFVGTLVDLTERKRAEKKLRLREQQLGLIYDSTAEILFHLGVEGGLHYRFLTVNSAFLKATGLTAEEVVGKTIDEVIPESSLKLVRSNYEKAVREGRIVSWEESSEYPTGPRTGIVSIAPIFDESGNCTYLVGSVHDITDQKKSQTTLEVVHSQLRLSIDRMPIAYILWDTEGKVLEWNPAAETIFGFTHEEAVGQSFADLVVPAEARPAVDEVLQALLTGTEASYSEPSNNVRKNGTVISCQWFNTPITDDEGSVTAVLSMAIDVTEPQQSLQRLRESEERYRLLVESTGVVPWTCLVIQLMSGLRRVFGQTIFTLTIESKRLTIAYHARIEQRITSSNIG